MAPRFKRRELLAFTGAAAVTLPFAALGQPAGLPAIGFLTPRTRASGKALLGAFQLGLAQSGFADGRNVTIEHRWAEDRVDRLPEFAVDLVRRNVAVIVAGGTSAAVAAIGATKTIPIVFTTGGDPVRLGLVASLSRPGGNVTGVTFYLSLLIAKQIELLNDLVPNVRTIGILVNPNSPVTEPTLKDARAAAQSLGKQLHVLPIAAAAELEPAFASLAQLEIGGLVLAADPFFDSRPAVIAGLAARHAVPAVYYAHEFVDAGGIISYGAEFTDAYRQVGIYAGQILKGAKPAEMPVVQPTKFQLVINRKAAATLGLAIPPSLLVGADEVIE